MIPESQRIENTIDYLDTFGWIRGSSGSPRQKACMRGAYYWINTGLLPDRKGFPVNIFWEVLESSTPVSFNDYLAQDYYEVKSVLVSMLNIAIQQEKIKTN